MQSNTKSNEPLQPVLSPGNEYPPGITEAEFDRNFKPKGAIAFFILLIILGMAIWFGIYFIMLDRA
ncbi:MAG: hypothetical protein ACXWB9_08350 [Flavisolibacter sp.]